MNESIKLPDAAPLLAWYAQHARDLPWRHTRDPYRIWVSEIMLQQTRVEAVIRYYERFLARLPDVAALAACPEEELLKLWEGLGYYSRVRNMQRAAREIMSAHGGVFPQKFEAIRALPGIGEYTAGAIGAFAFDLPVPAVDGNVLRVVARLCDYSEDILTPAARRTVTEAVAAAQPRAHAAAFNQAMIELGATVCLPNGTPKCELCPFVDACKAKARDRIAELPVRKKAAPRKIEERTVLILREGERIALRRRPTRGLLAGLFEPPCLSGYIAPEEVRALFEELDISPLYVTPLEDAVHIFTHLEWHMRGVEVILAPGDFERIRANGAEKLREGLFLAPREEIDEKYALPSAYRAYRPYM